MASLHAPSLHIVIKNVTDFQAPGKFDVTLRADDTVLDLKNMLEKSFPGSPPVVTQRLVCGGKVLKDNSLLEEALSNQKQPYTIHLVVVEIKRTQQTPQSSKATSTAAPSVASGSPAPVVAASREIPRAVAETEIRSTPAEASSSASFSRSAPAPAAAAPVVASTVAPTTDTAPTTAPTTDTAPTTAPTTDTAPTTAPTTDAASTAAPAPAPAPDAAAAPAPNAAPAPAPEVAPAEPIAEPGAEAEQPRPAPNAQPQGAAQFLPQIQWHLALKLGLFVAILSANGSTENLFMLSVVAFIIYLYQAGKLEFLMKRVMDLSGNLLNRRRRATNSEGQLNSGSNSPSQSPNWWQFICICIYSFFFAFVCSLFPTWKPRTMIPPPPGTAEEDSDEEPLPAAEPAPAEQAPPEEHPHYD